LRIKILDVICRPSTDVVSALTYTVPQRVHGKRHPDKKKDEIVPLSGQGDLAQY
jgi:hypothetical protein